MDCSPSVEIPPLIEKAARKEHPRLLVSAEDLQRLGGILPGEGLAAEIARGILREADALLGLPPIERIQTGRRLLGQSRKCLKRTLLLATAFHLTGKGDYVERCRQEMLAVAGFSDWNPSHFLDVGEMTFALAIGYDWLFAQLSEEDRKVIARAILDKGVRVPLTTEHRDWIKASNNWGQVCHGGMLAGAVATVEDDPESAAQTLRNALDYVPLSMAVYKPRGSYSEGPSYWNYGTSFNVLLIDTLETAFGTDFGLADLPGFDQTGQYIAQVTGPSGEFFNYADGGRNPAKAQPALYWFAKRYQRPDWLLGLDKPLADYLQTLDAESAATSACRLFPMILHWLPESLEIEEVSMPRCWAGGGRIPIAILRSSWTEPRATYVGIKAGSPSGPHGHMDAGSFVLEADGKRWASDLGAEGYHGVESRGMNLWNSRQDSDRWRIFRLSNHSHNTLVIDGQLQVARGESTLVEHFEGPEFPHVVMDLSSVYEGQAGSVQRRIALLPSAEVLVQDRLAGLQPGVRVRWGMMTQARVEKIDGSKVELALDDERLVLWNGSPVAAEWMALDCDSFLNEWDSPNPGFKMLVLTAVVPESGNLAVDVLATPGSCRESMKKDIDGLNSGF